MNVEEKNRKLAERNRKLAQDRKRQAADAADAPMLRCVLYAALIALEERGLSLSVTSLGFERGLPTMKMKIIDTKDACKLGDPGIVQVPFLPLCRPEP
jgi:hypothetical protein